MYRHINVQKGVRGVGEGLVRPRGAMPVGIPRATASREAMP